MQIKLSQTEDGSSTLFVPALNEHYHSIHGAIQESKHVFINSGFNNIAQEEIKILEIGFGTGLNTILTFLEAKKQQKIIQYDTLELFPIPIHIVNQLNYSEILQIDSNLLSKIHDANWNKKIAFSKDFMLNKLNMDLLKFKTSQKYDLIYFDAFAPDKQPELWHTNVFLKLFDMMNNNAVLVSYCAKGSFKRQLKSIGFNVESLPGPPGKREMVRAIKTT